VRDFTPEQLSEAKAAANSILATGFLPKDVADQVRNIISIIDAEFARLEAEAKKKDDEEKKRRGACAAFPDGCGSAERIDAPIYDD
jgi:hypothetical protein